MFSICYPHVIPEYPYHHVNNSPSQLRMMGDMIDNAPHGPRTIQQGRHIQD